jgi:hypothetical protein
MMKQNKAMDKIELGNQDYMKNYQADIKYSDLIDLGKAVGTDTLKDAQDKIVNSHDGLMKSVSNYFMQQLTPKNQNYHK